MRIEENRFVNLTKVEYSNERKFSFKLFTVFLLLSIIIYYLLLIKLMKRNLNKLFSISLDDKLNQTNLQTLNKTNLDLNDEFFQIKEVIKQINKKNLTNIETVGGGAANVGNALKMLNNFINICEKIKCKNIITPYGLQNIIKNPINYKEYNITIFPSSFENKMKVDIKLSNPSIYYFSYKKKPHEMRLKVIREEVLNNIPKYNISPDDLYINIRSGDIFVNAINSDYSQPPLCFYQKIINEKNYKNNFIVSNGHENPVVDKLLKLFPEIKYVHDSVEGDISIIVNAYNLIMPVSTFPWTLIRLNYNLINLYIYELNNYNWSKINSSTIHIMKPSPYYDNIMKRKWKKTKKQLELMINENCSDSNFTTIFLKKKLNLL